MNRPSSIDKPWYRALFTWNEGAGNAAADEYCATANEQRTYALQLETDLSGCRAALADARAERDAANKAQLDAQAATVAAHAEAVTARSFEAAQQKRADDLAALNEDHVRTVTKLTGELAKAEARRGQLDVQLAGCGAAAKGYGDDVKPGDYGHSFSFQCVVECRERAEQFRARLDAAVALLKEMPGQIRLLPVDDPHATDLRSWAREIEKFLSALDKPAGGEARTTCAKDGCNRPTHDDGAFCNDHDGQHVSAQADAAKQEPPKFHHKPDCKCIAKLYPSGACKWFNEGWWAGFGYPRPEPGPLPSPQAEAESLRAQASHAESHHDRAKAADLRGKAMVAEIQAEVKAEEHGCGPLGPCDFHPPVRDPEPFTEAPVSATDVPHVRRPLLEKELRVLLNRHCEENASNTPDFLLAQYVLAALDAANNLINEREYWHGRATKAVKP
jgi:hypothetical protein